MSLAAGSVWSAALSRGSFFLLIYCLKNESSTTFLLENFYLRWIEVHSSSEIWRHFSADPARNKKKKGFGLLECVHLLQEGANHSFQADVPTKGNLEPFLSGHMNMSRNLTCFINLISSILQPTASIWNNVFNIPSMFSVLWPFLWYRLTNT